jgi:hypothetical protein
MARLGSKLDKPQIARNAKDALGPETRIIATPDNPWPVAGANIVSL